MISLNGTTWTDQEETLEMFEFFQKNYGVDIVEPSCMNEYQGQVCGKITCYIVEEGTYQLAKAFRDGRQQELHQWRFKNPAVQLIGHLTRLAMFHHIDKIYIPVRMCGRCSAAQEGWSIAHFSPTDIEQAVILIKSKPMTQVEQDEYRNVLLSAYKNERARIEQNIGKKSVEANRYKIRGGAPA